MLKFHKWSIAGIAFIACIIGVLNALSAVPIYQSEARLLVRYNQQNLAGTQQYEGTPMHYLFYETQSDILRSRALAERVVDALGLDEVKPSASPPPAARSEAQLMVDSIKAQLPNWREWIPEEWQIKKSQAPVFKRGPKAAAIGRVLGGLSVSGGKASEVMSVRYESADPREASTMANAVAEAYIGFRLESRFNSASEATSWLGKRLEELRAKLAQSELALSQFQATEGMVDTVNRENIISARLGSLTSEFIRAQTKRAEAESRYQQVKNLDGEVGDRVSVAVMVQNPLVLEAHREKLRYQRRASELGERYGEKHPKMISTLADLEAAKRSLKEEVVKSVEQTRKEYEIAKIQEAKLQQFIDQQQSEMRSLSGKAYELAKLEREVDANRELYVSFLGRFKEADVAADYDLTDVRIIDRAQTPRTPFKPNKTKMVMIAVIMGLFVGIGLAFARYFLDRSIKSREDVEGLLGLPVLGTLAKLRKRPSERAKTERFVSLEPHSTFSEAVNDIRTALLFSRVDDPPKVLLVTSAVAAEGKTTLASNLALAFCKRGATLLVDADLRKGRLNQVTQLGKHLGLTDVITGECTLQDAIVADPDAENLFVLTAGTTPPNPLEIISSAKLAKALAKLRSTFEYIIIDGSPLMPVSDSLVLGHLVDGVLFVVHSGKTSKVPGPRQGCSEASRGSGNQAHRGGSATGRLQTGAIVQVPLRILRSSLLRLRSSRRSRRSRYRRLGIAD